MSMEKLIDSVISNPRDAGETVNRLQTNSKLKPLSISQHWSELELERETRIQTELFRIHGKPSSPFTCTSGVNWNQVQVKVTSAVY